MQNEDRGAASKEVKGRGGRGEGVQGRRRTERDLPDLFRLKTQT